MAGLPPYRGIQINCYPPNALWPQTRTLPAVLQIHLQRKGKIAVSDIRKSLPCSLLLILWFGKTLAEVTISHDILPAHNDMSEVEKDFKFSAPSTYLD